MTGAVGTLPALALYRSLQESKTKQYDQIKTSEQVKKEVEYFKKRSAEIKSPKEFLDDPRLLRFAATAYGLEQDLKYPARLKKVLSESAGKEDALVNRLLDPRYREINKAFGFGDIGVAKVKISTSQQTIVDKYVEAAFEKSLGQRNPALREAAYFERKIANVQSAYEILGDPVLRAVVTYTLDLPAQIAIQTPERQKALIEQKLDIKKFSAAAAGKSNSALADAEADLKKLTPASQAIDAAIAKVGDIVSRLQSLRNRYDQLANEQSATGPYAAEIPFQQAAVPTLARQTGLLAAAGKATDRIDVLNGTLASAIAEAQDPATTAARKTELKTIFQTTVNEINQLVSEATYNGENLIDGSIAGQISVQISSGGQSTVVNGRNLSTGFLDNLAAANAAFQADDFAGADTGYDSASTVFGAVRTGLTQDSNAFNESIATVQRWVPTLATANLYNASEAVNKAQAATTSASGLIAQIRTLAAQASDAGLDATTRANLNTQYLALRDQLRDAIAGASQAGSSLLDGSTVSIGAGAGANEVVIDGSGTVLKIGGENLKQFADDTTLPPDSLYNLDLTTAAGAASIVGKVDNTIDPAISKAFRTLATYDAIYDFTANTLDPRGAIDRDYRKLSADLDGLIKGAKSGNNNLLEPTAADIIVRSAVTGATVTARAYTTFRSLVESSLLTGKDQLPTDFSAARRALDDAAFFARQVQTNLNTDRVVFKSQLERVTQAKTEAQKNEPTKETNAYIRSFIEKYLLKKDAEAAKSGFNVGSGGNAYVLNLLT